MAGAAAVMGAGLLIRWRTRIRLGTPLPPFLISWSPHVRWPAAVGLLVALGIAGAAPWAIGHLRSRGAFALLSYAVTLAVGLSVNTARRGPAGWSHVFDLSGHGSFEASREYLPALKWLEPGVGHYVRRFPEILPYLPTHTKGNPPGPLVAMHALSITSAAGLSAVCVLVGALVAPLTYELGCELGDERRGRQAAALTALSPSVVLFGVTSVDFVFAAFAAAVACLLLARRRAVVAAGCLAAGIAAFFSWVLLAIPMWAAVAVLRRDGLRAGIILGAGAFAGVILVTLALGVEWGYDPVSILRTASRIYGGGAAAHRPYAFWVVGSPAAWLAMLGAPIAWLALRALARGDPAAVSLAAVVAISTLAGFTKGETERIWLPYVPLACVAAAALPVRRLGLILAVLALQAVVIEVLFGTVW
jgi:methylthioxylose transferase